MIGRARGRYRKGVPHQVPSIQLMDLNELTHKCDYIPVQSNFLATVFFPSPIGAVGEYER